VEKIARVDYSVNTMVVGHLPFLEWLTSFLITGRQSPVVFKLQNGGILCLDHIGIHRRTGRHMLLPKQTSILRESTVSFWLLTVILT